jgi:carboxypeptidase PM20D1
MNRSTAEKRTLRHHLGRAARWSAVALIAAAMFLMINTMRLRSKQISVDPVAPSDLDKEALSQVLVKFLDVPSYSYHDRSEMSAEAFIQLHEILQESFPTAHRILERETVNDLSLVYRWPAHDPSADPILLMSHLDVVPIEASSLSDWTHAPDEPKIADGYIWGRGALDVKCGVIGIMAAIEQLAIEGFSPKRDIYLAFGHDEEVGGQDGNGVIARQFEEQGLRFAFVVDEGGAILDRVIPGIDRPVAFIAIAEKRSADLTLTAHGAGGHSSISGSSAVVNLARAITQIDEKPMPARMTESTSKVFDYLASEMPLVERTVIANRTIFGALLCRQLAAGASTAAVVRSTINVTSLGTTTVSNQTATVATATINARLLPGDSVDDVLSHIEQITDDIRLDNGQRAIEIRSERVSSGDQVAPTDCDEFRVIQRTIHQVFPDVIVAPGLTAFTTDSAKYFPVCDKVYRFIPMRLNQTDMERIHGIDERIGVDNLAEIASFYMQLLRNFAAAK